ncbi:MAG: hypothetical protein PHN38_00395 [Sulfurospirillaceae bacterium]|nr:hypothetical protein [Sulfurospirillaceae bacterium]
MIAGAFAYFNYRFSEYKFIDFDKWIYYRKSDIFQPDKERYLVLFYSSSMQDVGKILEKMDRKEPILAVDLYLTRPEEDSSAIYITSGTNTLLKMIQRFNIYEAPCYFYIKRIRNGLYKQDSAVNLIEL